MELGPPSHLHLRIGGRTSFENESTRGGHLFSFAFIIGPMNPNAECACSSSNDVC